MVAGRHLPPLVVCIAHGDSHHIMEPVYRCLHAFKIAAQHRQGGGFSIQGQLQAVSWGPQSL